MYTIAFLFFIFLSFIVVSVPALVALRRGSLDLFEPIFFKMFFMNMILIALVDRALISGKPLRHQEVVQFNPEQAFLLLSILYFFLFSSIIFGYYFSGSLFSGNIVSIPSINRSQISAVRKISILYIVIGLVAYIILITNNLEGNPLQVFTGRPRSEVFSASSSGFLLVLMRGAYMGFFFYISTRLAEEKGINSKFFVLFAIILSIFITLGGRGRVLRIFLILVVVLYYAWIKDLFRVSRTFRIIDPTPGQMIKTLIIPFLAIPTGILALSARYVRWGEDLPSALSRVDYFRILTLGINNDRFDYFLVLVSSDEISTNLGLRYLRAPLNFIPRSIWPNKPPMYLGTEIREVVLPNLYGGRPPGELGYYYAELSYPGIVIFGILSGMLLRVSYIFLTENSKSPVALIIYATLTIPFIISGLTNGSIWIILNHLLWITPVLYICLSSRD